MPLGIGDRLGMALLLSCVTTGDGVSGRTGRQTQSSIRDPARVDIPRRDDDMASRARGYARCCWSVDTRDEMTSAALQIFFRNLDQRLAISFTSNERI